MSRNRNDFLFNSQKSKRIIHGMEEDPKSKEFLAYYRSFYVHLLFDDIRIHLFPYRNEEEIIRLEASDESLEKLYFTFDSYRGGLHYQILEFLRYCATSVLLE